MKRFYPLAALAALALAACSSGGGGSSGPVAPDMGSATDIPALSTAAGSAPSAATAETFALDATDAVGTLLDTETGTSSKRAKILAKALGAIRKAARASSDTAGGTLPIDIDADLSGGGHLAVSGSYTLNDMDIRGLKLNATNTLKGSMSLSLAGTITGVSAASATHTYTVSGKMKEEMDSDYSMEITLGATLFDMTVGSSSMSFSLAYGVAYNVLRDDGVGAKIILTVAASGNLEALTSSSANLKVYDSATNALISDVTVPLEDLGLVDDSMDIGI